MKHGYDPDEDWAELFDDFVAQGYDDTLAASLARGCVAATLKRLNRAEGVRQCEKWPNCACGYSNGRSRQSDKCAVTADQH